MKGPFAVFVTRVGAWWQVIALYQGRGIGGGRRRIARSSGGTYRERADALTTAKQIINEMRAN